MAHFRPAPKNPKPPLLLGHREDAALRCEWCDAHVRVDSRGRCSNCGAPAPTVGLVIEPGLVLALPPGRTLAPDPALTLEPTTVWR